MTKSTRGKAPLIAHANEIIKAKYPEFIFDAAAYKITVWSNLEKTIVKYHRLIWFTPLGREDDNLRYDFEVNLSNKDVSPFDTWGMDNFYFPTMEEQEKIDFVVKAFRLPRAGFNNSIHEDTDTYHITLKNKAAFGHHSIDKITGKKCKGSKEGSYIQRRRRPGMPERTDPDPLIEIRE